MENKLNIWTNSPSFETKRITINNNPKLDSIIHFISFKNKDFVYDKVFQDIECVFEIDENFKGRKIVLITNWWSNEKIIDNKHYKYNKKKGLITFKNVNITKIVVYFLKDCIICKNKGMVHVKLENQNVVSKYCPVCPRNITQKFISNINLL